MSLINSVLKVKWWGGYIAKSSSVMKYEKDEKGLFQYVWKINHKSFTKKENSQLNFYNRRIEGTRMRKYSKLSFIW